MQCLRKSVLVSHSAQEMFDLVDRVEDYPRFLPWCGGVQVHERSDEVLDVTIKIEFLKSSKHNLSEPDELLCLKNVIVNVLL